MVKKTYPTVGTVPNRNQYQNRRMRQNRYVNIQIHDRSFILIWYTHFKFKKSGAIKLVYWTQILHFVYTYTH
jgi:hypothetical protein